MNHAAFDQWFEMLVGGLDLRPHPWQQYLASESVPRSRFIRIPTGMGKTLGVLAAWSWYRVCHKDGRWPRRLVWCLPMRVLVEQTESVVREGLKKVGLLWHPKEDHRDKVGVHILMGGADPNGDWNLYPEECAVLIGTQDMLLSRALNRGFAAGRARWPLEFGLLSHDALWVMDEIQLMDVGLATSAQLQAFHDEDAAKGFRPRVSWWMSATLQPKWLRSVDTQSRYNAWSTAPCTVDPSRRRVGLGQISKSLDISEIAAKNTKAFAARSLEEHNALNDGPYGRITLVVCNTVDRACDTFDAIKAAAPDQEIELVHSRFRSADRASWRERFLNRQACAPGVNRIVVATQVVEAGVDISAGCVVTDLAPWPSLVQRFGRCARYGGWGKVVVMDRGRDDKYAPPYEVSELDSAWFALEQLGGPGADVGIARLEEFEESLSEADRARLYPYEPRHLLLRRELDELFDTTPDLSGADLDISRFIRSGEERDLQVFWLEVPKAKKSERATAPDSTHRPRREELCNVPFLRARDWLCGEETQKARKPRLRPTMRAWVWDWIDGAWVVAERAALIPGRIVCVAADCGGYRVDRGFDVTCSRTVPVVDFPPTSAIEEAQERADSAQDAEELSAAPEWKTIACHVREVADEARAIGITLEMETRLREILELAGRWHDLGKAHPAFQGLIRQGEGRPQRQDLAKAPKLAWGKKYLMGDGGEERPGFRHELASTLALFAVLQRHAPRHEALLGPWSEALELLGTPLTDACTDEIPTPCEQAVLDCSADEFDLLAYLVMCHHGKVRVALHAGPKDQDYVDRDQRGLPIRGVRNGDALPSVMLDSQKSPLPSLKLTLEPASLGLSSITGRSWRDRTSDLLRRYGPGALAWLEALLIAADRRASKLSTPDALLVKNGALE